MDHLGFEVSQDGMLTKGSCLSVLHYCESLGLATAHTAHRAMRTRCYDWTQAKLTTIKAKSFLPDGSSGF